MRNSASSTPKTNTDQDATRSTIKNAEKTSVRKLKQARLPFKVIAPGTSPVGIKASPSTPVAQDRDKVVDVINSTDNRKRKLSYDETDSEDDDGINVAVVDHNVRKENIHILTAANKKKKISAGVGNNNTTTDIVSVLDEEDIVGTNKADAENSSTISETGRKDLTIKTRKHIANENERNDPTTPSNQDQGDKVIGSTSKLQIKLPLSGGKKKRRKSKIKFLINKSTAGNDSHNDSPRELSSDDIEEIAVELNPHKRKKTSNADEETHKKAETQSTSEEQKQIDTISLASDQEDEEKEDNNKNDETKEAASVKEKLSKSNKPTEQTNQNRPIVKGKSEGKEIELQEKVASKSLNKVAERSSKNEDNDVENIDISKSSDEDGDKCNDDDKDVLDESVLTEHDPETDEERENFVSKAANTSSDNSENSKTRLNSTLGSQKDDKNVSLSSTSSKNQTPKQMKLMEQRRKAREEKERKLQEEKLKKQQEKEEKELAKKRERKEKEEQRRQERKEKEDQKRKEREEKERKRLAEVEAKNEEKRKKNEAKEEELRKKDEERKRKEQEKEEAELKKKKAAQAFTKFFVAKTSTSAHIKNDEDSNTGDDSRLLAFRPFQIKGDMKLAPIYRKNFGEEEKLRLDDLLGCKNGNKNDDDEQEDEIVRRKPLPKSQLYLSELRSGKIWPGKWRRLSTESKDDVILVEDELERVGQAIVEDTPAYIREQMRVKFYKFHDNRRPPYYGTWRKKSSVISPRKPFAQDKKFFDYEVDSDDEWEEEEPGESLEDGSDDDKEKESEDDDYEVDNEWFVPHGHLSDEELQNEDEFGLGDDNSREAQKAKLQILQQEFAQEMKKKTEKIKPRLIGCIWTDINGHQPSDCANILWETIEKKAMLYNEPPLVDEPEGDKPADLSSPSGAANSNNEKSAADKLKPILLSDNMVKDLARLVHGNNHSKNFLINEYIAYIEKTEESVKNGDLRKPLKSVVRDKIDDMAEWQVIDDLSGDTAESTKKKKKGKKRLCWVVRQDMLDKMDLNSLKLQNSWEYILPPKFVRADKEAKGDDTPTNETTSTSTFTNVAEESSKGKHPATTSQITKFTKVLTAEEKETKLLNTPALKNTTSNDKTITETKSNTSNTTNIGSSKEKKRVSAARGQQTSTPAKNKLISQFLQQKSKVNENHSSSPTTRTESRSKIVTSPEVEDDDVVILD